jgi:hypothetical protein
MLNQISDLVDPRGVRGREVETDVGLTAKPPVVLRLMCVQVVEDHVELDVLGKVRHHLGAFNVVRMGRPLMGGVSR